MTVHGVSPAAVSLPPVPLDGSSARCIKRGDAPRFLQVVRSEVNAKSHLIHAGGTYDPH